MQLLGECGTCAWRYKPLDNGGWVLEIAPIKPGRGGVLDKWDDVPPWHDVTEMGIGVVVMPGVKALTCKNMFSGFKNLKMADLSGLDVSGVTDMSGMFRGCESLSICNVSTWNVSNVKNMSYMFYGCRILTAFDASTWDTSSVENAEHMFEGCEFLSSLDMSGWKITTVSGKDWARYEES